VLVAVHHDADLGDASLHRLLRCASRGGRGWPRRYASAGRGPDPCVRCVMTRRPPPKPAGADFDPERLPRIHALVERGRDQGLYLGAAYQVIWRGAVVAEGTVGLASEQDDRPVTSGTLFDLASLTKPMGTATSVLILAERGASHLEEAVTRFLPADAAATLEGITLRHLLTHTSGLPAWRQYHSRDLDGPAIHRLVRTQPRERPIG